MNIAFYFFCAITYTWYSRILLDEKRKADRKGKTIYCPEDKLLEIFLWITAMGVTQERKKFALKYRNY